MQVSVDRLEGNHERRRSAFAQRFCFQEQAMSVANKSV